MKLSAQELKYQFDRCQAVEQWLGTWQDGQDTILKWVRLCPNRDGTWRLRFREVYDQGDSVYTDICSFQSYDPDEPDGIIKDFDVPEVAVAYAVSEYGADEAAFIRDGMTHTVYRSFAQEKESRSS
jgi:hypothetical protein